ncbi:MAG: hypothetical protein NUV69_00610 [Candidatus Curtissbacteria bacterium]|nr:hypothetical protein [Candidatus Curtissbacteria bacterium]
MPNQNKPSAEELKAKEEEAIKAAEELEGRQQIPQDEEKEETPEPEVVPEPEAPEEEPKEEEEQAEPSEEEKEALKKKLEDEKKKSSASARENQKIYAKNRVINKALTDADEIPEPTEEELVKEFPDWDVMSDIEKTLAKETVVSRSWRKVISDAKAQATKIEKWNESVETFVDDPKTLIDNPDLEGKTEEFKEFATKEENNSVPFKILTSAFLHDHSTNKPNNKGRMFEKGSGGPNDKPQPKNGKLTLEEGRKLRESNYNLWKEKLSAGLIESDL